MAIQFPRVHKNFNFFVDGNGFAGRVEEIVLPKLSLATEESRYGGMDLPIEQDMGMAALTGTVTFGGIEKDVLSSFGLLSGQGIPVTVRSPFQAQGEAAIPVVVNLTATWKEVDFGTWKPGSKAPIALAYTATYYKLTVDGDELIEIDALNMIRKIGGVDQLESQRTALGM